MRIRCVRKLPLAAFTHLNVRSNQSQSDMTMRYSTGDLVPATGIYRVTHNLHRLPHEAVLLANERFPRCARCNSDVLFELAYAAPDLLPTYRTRIYELPVVENEFQNQDEVSVTAVMLPKADDNSNCSSH